MNVVGVIVGGNSYSLYSNRCAHLQSTGRTRFISPTSTLCQWENQIPWDCLALLSSAICSIGQRGTTTVYLRTTKVACIILCSRQMLRTHVYTYNNTPCYTWVHSYTHSTCVQYCTMNSQSSLLWFPDDLISLFGCISLLLLGMFLSLDHTCMVEENWWV